MRSFRAKIFACMLLVPLLARGVGMLLESTLGDPRPQSERTLAMVMPGVASLAAAALQHGQSQDVETALARTQGILNLLPPASHCADPRLDGLAAPLPGSAGLCLGGLPPPRPPLLGILPARWSFLMPVLGLIFSAVISFFLARYLAAPILRTRDAAVAFASGDLTARAAPARAVARRDEAADLAREFNRMADRVSTLIDAQQRFIGDVSHEIRSPLGRLAMTVGLIRRDASPDLLAKLERMEHELDAISRLVRELLVLSSLQGSIGPARREVIDLPDMLDRVVDDLTFEFHERAQGFRTIRRAGGPIEVRGDAAVLRRAVENVLRNALFYTPDDTLVETMLECDGAWARLVVRDHGPGVPEVALPHLFEPFFRVDQARARNTGGVGLGLAISQRAVELHGGRIRAANAQPNGLAIRIELPAAANSEKTGGLGGMAHPPQPFPS